MAHRNQRPHIARGRFLPDSLIQINSPNYSTRIQQVRKHAAAAVLDTDDGFFGPFSWEFSTWNFFAAL